jgi:hypothetical protein
MANKIPLHGAVLLAAALVFFAARCSSGGEAAADATAPHAVPFFTETAHAAGITHRHRKPVLDPQLDNIMPWMQSVGAAAAAGDFDNDGRIPTSSIATTATAPSRTWPGRLASPTPTVCRA